ncbi:hypothetical protein REPUB_Repub18cG0066800 [Reevesia pubescens]
MAKLRIVGIWVGVIELELENWTVAMLRAEVAKRTNAQSPDSINLISAGSGVNGVASRLARWLGVAVGWWQQGLRVSGELNALSNLEELYMLDNEVNGFVPSQVSDGLSLEKLFISCIASEGVRSNACSLPPKSLGLFPSSLKTLSLAGFNFNGTMTTQIML